MKHNNRNKNRGFKSVGKDYLLIHYHDIVEKDGKMRCGERVEINRYINVVGVSYGSHASNDRLIFKYIDGDNKDAKQNLPMGFGITMKEMKIDCEELNTL